MGLSEANQHFSRAVRAVKAGREVVLTERGRPIAVIRPVAGPDRLEAALERLAAEGRVRLARVAGPIPSRRWKPVTVKGPALSKVLRDDRHAR